jgi:succinate-semialdehyde dehydrogenase/glutarate-semialdehyde dehydrogenase
VTAGAGTGDSAAIGVAAVAAAAPAAASATPRPTVVSRNPATGDVLGEVPVHGPAEVRAAVERARGAQRGWATLPVKERGEILQEFRRRLVARGREMAELISREQGKTLPEAYTHDILTILDLTRYYGSRAAKVLAPHKIPLHLLKHRRSYVHYVPRGVVGIIAPWNFPLAIPFGETIMSLLAGNGVVLKPSEHTPLIALKGKEILDEAGVPPDLVQVVTGYGETGAALIDGGVDMVIFTGSVRTGRRVAAACGERLIPCTVELGGKAAAVVCADADLERTAQALVWGAFANSGQVCASVERVYAHAAVHDRLVDRVAELARKLKQGSGLEDGVDVGPMCWDKQVEIVEEHVRDAVAKGARVVTGGQRAVPGGQMFQPTVLVGCDMTMKVMREETFGPLMPFMKVASEDEAVALANDSHLGLLGYVFSDDRARARRLAERVEAGTVMVNDVLATYGAPETPWAGVKQSGLGRVHSDDGLRDLCQARHVNTELVRLMDRELWWFPYTPKRFQRIVSAVKLIFG